MSRNNTRIKTSIISKTTTTTKSVFNVNNVRYEHIVIVVVSHVTFKENSF